MASDSPSNPNVVKIQREEAERGVNRPPTPVPEYDLPPSPPISQQDATGSSPVEWNRNPPAFSMEAHFNQTVGATQAQQPRAIQMPGDIPPPFAYAHDRPTSTNPNCPAFASIIAGIPVQQHFSGPAATFISVFPEPGEYNIRAFFQSERVFSQQQQLPQQDFHPKHL